MLTVLSTVISTCFVSLVAPLVAFMIKLQLPSMLVAGLALSSPESASIEISSNHVSDKQVESTVLNSYETGDAAVSTCQITGNW